MSDEQNDMKRNDEIPVAEVNGRRGLSIIWVVPIVALVIGGWLAFQAWSEKGPEVTITFEHAEGLEADKTKIRYKEVVLGKVTDIKLSDDFNNVLVTAEMSKDAAPYLTDKTRFWVVRARVAAGEVSGLGTLFSGAYIGVDPQKDGKPTNEFVGLEKPPVVTTGLPGRHFVLETPDLGSLDIGSPVYYRGIKVGQVVDYDFDEFAESVLIQVFINDPYHQKVFSNSRFWNASGINLSVDATGVTLDTQSLVSVMLGGLTFDLPEHAQPGKQAEENSNFKLYPDRESTKERSYRLKSYYLMYFTQSVRGLSPGAPVEVMGIKVGEVVNVELQFDMRSLDFRIPVLVLIEPERIHELITEQGELVAGKLKDEEIVDEGVERKDVQIRLARLVDKGFRAQLKPGNLLTGQLYVDLAFYPDAEPADIRKEQGYEVFPTVSAPLEQIVKRVDRILGEVEKVPFGQIGEDLQVAVESLNSTLGEMRQISGNVNRETIPRVNAALDQLQETLDGIDTAYGEKSTLNQNAQQIVQELAVTIRSIRSLLSYLERDPQALIFGKEGDQQ